MKKRLGFVSNSSSSSFIVISNREDYMDKPIIINNTLRIPRSKGDETDFGMYSSRYYDFGSKLNYAYLQCLYADSNKLKEMLFGVLREFFGKDLVIDEKLTSDNFYFYSEEDDEYGEEEDDNNNTKTIGGIDHQSVYVNSNVPRSLFSSKENLRDFLFCNSSYLAIGHEDSIDYHSLEEDKGQRVLK